MRKIKKIKKMKKTKKIKKIQKKIKMRETRNTRKSAGIQILMEVVGKNPTADTAMKSVCITNVQDTVNT